MGMMGSRRAQFDALGLPAPSITDRALNQVGMNLLGVDVLGMKRNRALADAQNEYLDALQGRLVDQPEADIVSPVANSQGADISAAFGPQITHRPGMAALNANSPELAAIALQGQRLGVPIDKVLEVLKAQQPDVRFDRGFGYNGKTGAAMGGYHPELEKGQVLTPQGVMTIPGFTGSVGEIEGAKTGAQERAKAPFNFQTVIGPDGKRRTISNATAAALGADGGIIATGPSDAELSAAKIQGDAEATRRTELPAKMAGYAAQLAALDEMEGYLPDVISGFGSGIQLQAQRALAAAGNEDARRKVVATETFLNQGRVLVSNIIKTFGANPTEGERKYAERMSGADAQLNPETLKEGIRLQRQRINREMASAQRPVAAGTRPSGGRSLANIPLAERMAAARRRGLIP